MHHKVYKTFFVRLSLFTIIGLCTCSFSNAQKDILAKAKVFYDQKLYTDALAIYNQLPNINDKNTRLNKAICLIETNDLNGADSLINKLLVTDTSNPNFLFYRAYLFQCQGHFDLALKTYKQVLKRTKSKDQLKNKARYSIKKCRQEQKIKNKAQLAFVENLGPRVNSKYNDFGAIQSPNFQNVLYFNSDKSIAQSNKDVKAKNRRQTDMYSIEFVNGAWSSVSNFDQNLNTSLNEVLLGFPPDGSSVIYLQNDNSLKINHFSEDSLQTNRPDIFNSKIKAKFGDNYVQVFSDSIFIYSSLRTEGIGGYDIFIITLKNGEWQEPFHFGHSVNSAFNEICPFLSRDGKQLFFSSDRNESIGGYDIFMSEYNEKESQWTTPQNLGLPINSRNNDLYFRLDPYGNSANFTSDRAGGVGGLDLYIAYLKKENEHSIKSSGEIPFLIDSMEKLKIENHINTDTITDISEEDNQQQTLKSIELKPLFFNTNDHLIYGKQEDYILSLVNVLKEDQKLKIDIHSHSSVNGEFNFKLYSSIRQSEELVNYLIQNGISKNRILTKGFGDYFALNDSFKQNRIDADNLNKRVTFYIQHHDTTNLSIKNSVLSQNMMSSIYEEYLSDISKLSYSIEIAKTQRLYKSPQLELLPAVKVEKLGEFYHYSTGVFKTYHKAKSELNRIKKFNFQESKIIAYIDGLRIAEIELSEQLKIHQDLDDYIIDYYSNK